MVLFPKLEIKCKELVGQFSLISKDRKIQLQLLADYIANKTSKGKAARLTFICTHNSRRSQIGQLWLKLAAEIL